MSEADYLALDGLTLAYGRSVAVDRLDLNVADGELVALLGPSGCGKTTVMRAIAGLLAPASGRIRLAGRDITRVAANRREIGLVFQSYALFPHLTVFENVAFGLRLRGVAADEMGRRVAEAIAMVGLTGLERRLPRELSGGQQQRVALARSIVVRPRLLLLDEPLSNLDARLRLEMRSELQRLQNDLKVTMIYVTHDQAEALALAHRVVVMNAGRIAQSGSPADVYERPRSVFVARFMGFENVFLREPQGWRGTGGLLDLALAAGPDVRAVGWRPDGVAVGAGPYQGRVAGTSYLGDRIEYLLDTSAGPVRAQTPVSAARHAPGESVAFDLPAATAALLTDA